MIIRYLSQAQQRDINKSATTKLSAHENIENLGFLPGFARSVAKNCYLVCIWFVGLYSRYISTQRRLRNRWKWSGDDMVTRRPIYVLLSAGGG